MYLKCSRRLKNGKEHRTWSIVESRRVKGGSTIQRHVLYLGEINDSQRVQWQRTVEAIARDAHGEETVRQMALFPEDRVPEEASGADVVQIRLSQLSLHRPRQWGGCWLSLELWRELHLDTFWQEKLGTSREGTCWEQVLSVLVTHRLLAPGSEWELHRHWFDTSAMADLLGTDARVAAKDTLYRCLDHLLEHKAALFSHLQQRWSDLFGARFDILLYDLTSTYFEIDTPDNAQDKRRFGYSRDKRGDCVQVVIALVVTPDGFPLAYEVLPGNTSDKTTLRAFLAAIEKQYGKAQRIWVMDRGIPTEEVLAEMRAADPPVSYLVGTPKARLGQLEKELASRPWEQVRAGVNVKLLPRQQEKAQGKEQKQEQQQEQELYILAKSRDRIHKERAIRRRHLKKLWARLHELRSMKTLKRDDLLMKLGAARQQSPSAWRLVTVSIPQPRQAVTPETFTFSLNRKKLKEVIRHEGRYLLRSNLTDPSPSQLWNFYLQLTHIEEIFKSLKGDLGLRPIFHSREDRIEAHIFVAFLAYCLHVTLRQRLKPLASGLTPRALFDTFATIHMLDVHLPTIDGRLCVLSRYTQPSPELHLLIHQLGLSLPPQLPPQIRPTGATM